MTTSLMASRASGAARRVLQYSTAPTYAFRTVVPGLSAGHRWASTSKPDRDGFNPWTANLAKPVLNTKAGVRNMAYYDGGVFAGELDSVEAGDILASAITYDLEKAQRSAAEQVVPWFFQNMPDSYFKHIKRDEINRHLRALSALWVAGAHGSPSLMLQSDEEVTVINGADKPGTLRGILMDLANTHRKNKMQDRKPLQALKAFSAKDGSIVMDIIDFGKRRAFTGETDEEKLGRTRIINYIEELRQGQHSGKTGHATNMDLFDDVALEQYMRRCSSDYIAISDPRRFCLQREMYESVYNSEDVSIAVDDDTDWGPGSEMVTIAATNMLPEKFMLNITDHLSAFGINIQRAHVDVVLKESKDPEVNPNVINYEERREFVVMCRLLINQTTALPQWDGVAYGINDVMQGLKRVKWLDDASLRIFKNNLQELGADCLMTAEIISALINCSRTPLSKIDRYAYAGWRLEDVVTAPEHLPTTAAIARLLLERFDPNSDMNEEEFLAKADELRDEIKRIATTPDCVVILDHFVNLVTNVVKTNIHCPNRYALSFRLNPQVMHMTEDEKNRREIPYGVFFVHGRRFDGFHVRFRDIARGGLRMVTPMKRAYEAESCRHYDEAYGLAFAQQMKNKDIPEGGSKAVCLIRPSEVSQQPILVRKCVKGFIDGLLDLIGHDEAKDLIIDRNNKDEILYLGPDEQIIPEDIEWMANRAGKRKYFNGDAFISSKAENGINHKDYGVTSEGVNVFMEVALKRLGIDPYNQSFTVKLTGGPDGDVAGNMINIMNREYGTNVKVVGVADGFGAAEDPNGLDMEELLRLFENGFSMADYGAQNTSLREGSCVYHDVSTQEGREGRDTLAFRVKADAFVPAGGRPDTIRKDNCERFCDPETGLPSSPVIVEGANLFLTPEARLMLQQAYDVKIVKDSSANKCGVMCSSYEIMSAMLVDKQEFVDNKEEIVKDVQEKLKDLARTEANLLFDEYEKDKSEHLPNLSVRISKAIIKVADAVSEKLDEMDDSELRGERFEQLLEEHLPTKLSEMGFDRLHERVPASYIRQIIAKRLGTKLVYNEGLEFIEKLPDNAVGRVALGYIAAERDMKMLMENADSSDPEEAQLWKEKVVALLGEGSPRLLLENKI